jgi:hypothetical protein
MFGRPFSGIEQPSIDLNNNNESDYEGGLKSITDLRESVISTVKKNVTESVKLCLLSLFCLTSNPLFFSLHIVFSVFPVIR